MLLQFMLGKSMTEIHNGSSKISVTRIHNIIKQETYFLTKEKQVKDLSPLVLRDKYKDRIIEILEHRNN